MHCFCWALHVGALRVWALGAASGWGISTGIRTECSTPCTRPMGIQYEFLPRDAAAAKNLVQSLLQQQQQQQQPRLQPQLEEHVLRLEIIRCSGSGSGSGSLSITVKYCGP